VQSLRPVDRCREGRRQARMNTPGKPLVAGHTIDVAAVVAHAVAQDKTIPGEVALDGIDR
jgi:hypothetical protein